MNKKGPLIEGFSDVRGSLPEMARGVNEGYKRLYNPSFGEDDSEIFSEDCALIQMGPLSTIACLLIYSPSFIIPQEVTAGTPFFGYVKGPFKIKGKSLPPGDSYSFDAIFWAKPPPSIVPIARPAVPASDRAQRNGNEVPSFEIAVPTVEDLDSDTYYVGDLEDLTFREANSGDADFSAELMGSFDNIRFFQLTTLSGLNASDPDGTYRLATFSADPTSAPAVLQKSYYVPRINYIKVHTTGYDAGTSFLIVSGRLR